MTQRCPAWIGAGLPRSAIRACRPRGQPVAHRPIVVAAVQVHRAAGRQWAERGKGLQGGAEQGVVIAICRGGYCAQWDSSGVGDHGAFEALLAAVDRARAGGLPTTRRLGGAAVHG